MININKEANRCTGCGFCKGTCPCGINPKIMIELYLANDYYQLVKYIYRLNPFAGVCGYVCPNKFCMNKCLLNHIEGKPVNIKGLQTYFASMSNPLTDNPNEYYSNFDKKVLVIGGGVSGLTAANRLSQSFNVDILEKDKIGGELNLIPNDRLPWEVAVKDICRITNKPNVNIINEVKSFDDYEIVFDCTGCIPKRLEGFEQALTYDEYLKEDSKEETIAVIGGGNIALECALHNKGKTFMMIRRNLWDMKIEEESFKTLRDKHIQVVDNFTPTNMDKVDENYILNGIKDDNLYSLSVNKIVLAIGREPTPNIEGAFKIKPSNSIVETVAITHKQLEEILDGYYTRRI
jgi:NADPH-dependent glutamate synthase beta subunit-like oxidoreductase